MPGKYALMPIRADELAVEDPLPWHVYDSKGNLLFAKGAVLNTPGQRELVAQQGFLRESRKSVEETETSVTRKGKENRSSKDASKEVVTMMDQIKWMIGETLDLQPHDNPDVRYNVRLIGFARNKSVIVSAPVIDDKLAFVREGQTFVIRSFFGKRAYAFTASVLKCVYTPYSYLHLSYPSQVRLATVRKGARAKVRIIASVKLGESERTGAATLVDMSVGGTSAVATQVLGEKGERGRVVFRIVIDEHEHFMTLNAILRSVTASEKGNEYRHGFEFIDTTLQERLVLSAFVNQILVEMSE